MPETVVFVAPGNVRSGIIGRAMFEGLRRTGHSVEMRLSSNYRGSPMSENAVFYGLAGGLRRIMDDYRKRGKRAFYIDLGYWGRRKKSRWDGYHKIVLNDRHPTGYFQSKVHPSDRFDHLQVQIKPWRETGDAIMVVGMSGKAAGHLGLGPEHWERQTIARLRQITKRPIIYRPKPNWPDARPIPGSHFQQGVDVAESFAGLHCVVAHHSNVAVDALINGIPCICPEGAASVLSDHDIADVETPCMPDGREQWAADLSYCQFSVEEMQTGRAWELIKAEGLLG